MFRSTIWTLLIKYINKKKVKYRLYSSKHDSSPQYKNLWIATVIYDTKKQKIVPQLYGTLRISKNESMQWCIYDHEWDQMSLCFFGPSKMKIMFLLVLN